MKQVMNKTSKILLQSLLFVGLLTAVACKKNDQGGGVQPVAVGAAPLGACLANACIGVGSPALLVSASATATTSVAQIDFGMDILGNSASFNPADNKAVLFYQGPAAIAGYMKIQGVANAMLCMVPPGEYYLQAAAQGGMDRGVLTNARLSGVSGPVRIEATVSQGVLYNPAGVDKSLNTNRLYMTLRLDAVNGQPCGVIISTY